MAILYSLKISIASSSTGVFSLIFYPVRSFFGFHPTVSGTVVLYDVASIFGYGFLQNVEDAGSVNMVVNAEDTSGFDRNFTHAKLASRHAFNLWSKVVRLKKLYVKALIPGRCRLLCLFSFIVPPRLH